MVNNVAKYLGRIGCLVTILSCFFSFSAVRRLGGFDRIPEDWLSIDLSLNPTMKILVYSNFFLVTGLIFIALSLLFTLSTAKRWKTSNRFLAVFIAIFLVEMIHLNGQTTNGASPTNNNLAALVATLPLNALSSSNSAMPQAVTIHLDYQPIESSPYIPVLTALVPALLVGVLVAYLSSRLSNKRSELVFKRQKMEELYVAFTKFVRNIIDQKHAIYLISHHKRLSGDEIKSIAIIVANDNNQMDQSAMLCAIYFPELLPLLPPIQSRTRKINAEAKSIQELAKIMYSNKTEVNTSSVQDLSETPYEQRSKLVINHAIILYQEIMDYADMIDIFKEHLYKESAKVNKQKKFLGFRFRHM